MGSIFHNDGPFRIDDTAHRAISLEQLQRVIHAVEEELIHCGPWKRPQDESVISSIEDVTLYDLNTHWLLPATRQHECSLVELLQDTNQPQPPDYFVSHWWGEPVTAFLRCLQQHAYDRSLSARPGDERYDPRQSLGRSPRYWICAYSNNQHNLDVELSNPSRPDATGVDTSSVHDEASVAQTSFVRAMAQSRGTVLVVDDSSTCFNRLWCVYEIYSSLFRGGQSTTHGGVNSNNGSNNNNSNNNNSNQPYTFDIYTATSPRLAVGITDGLTSVDDNAECKFHRESTFPMERLERGMEFDCHQGHASLPSDERRIHMAIGDDGTHERLNEIVHGVVAASVLRKFLESSDISKQKAVLDALRRGKVRKLSLYMTGSPSDTAENINKVLNALDGQACELLYLESEALITLPNDFGRLVNLQHLSFMDCRNLKELPSDCFGKLQSLQDMHLQFCSSLTELPESFGDLSSLSWVSLDACPLRTLPSSIGKLGACLRYLYLTDCIELEYLPDEFTQLSNLSILQMNRCQRLTALPERMGDLVSLEDLQLERCTRLTSLPTSMKDLKRLKTLNLWHCSGLQSLPTLQQDSLINITTGGVNPDLVEAWEKSNRSCFTIY